ncbi:MAG TPA: hypothetical protein VHX49_01990 [Candidatus Acidoferrales bacterium]|jgi:hypothetical protein|nr:hypothetical protein [Candidatus Acidoferrales bacterium]
MGAGQPSQQQTEKWATVGISIVIVYTILRNVLAAAAKPFWFDELLTVAVARQPTFSAMWKAFGQAEDSATPLFWLVEHFFARMIPNAEIAYRLPSILGFACVLWCVFVFVRRRYGASVAFLCAVVPMLTPLYKPYAIEARGYSLVVACISIALLCYQRASRWPWVLLMTLSLIAAEAFHYYAFFAFFPFGLAELAWVAKNKKFRWRIWLALVAGFLPVGLSWHRLMEIKRFYGSSFWGKPGVALAANAYGLLLKTFAPIAIAVVTVLSLVAISTALAPEFSDSVEADQSDDHSHEPILAVGFFGILLVELVVTRIVHGSLVERYALATVLGLALSTGYLVRMLGRRSVALVAIFLLVAISLDEGFFWLSERGHFGKLDSPASSVEALLSAAGHADLPVVVSDGEQYIQLAYYGRPEWSERFVALVDHPAAVAYAGSDTLDRQMYVLPCCLALQVYDFKTFAPDHPTFLLYSNGADFDWWPQRLSHDGYSLRLLGANGGDKVYLADKNGS